MFQKRAQKRNPKSIEKHLFAAQIFLLDIDLESLCFISGLSLFDSPVLEK